MKRIVFLFLVIGVFLAGCQNKEYLEWENAITEFQNTASIVINKTMSNQTEGAIALCDQLSKDILKDSCYRLSIEIRKGMNQTIPISVCDKIILGVEIPSEKVMEKLNKKIGEKIEDYEKEKIRIIDRIKEEKEECYNLTKK